MKFLSLTLSAVSLGLILTACSDVGEKTTIGAATGGVLGAGLGAIVGSQTGSAGAGLAIGAAAGTAAGAAVGKVFDDQDQHLAAQTELLNRQEQQLTAQRSELEELRRLSQDSVGFKPSGTRVAALNNARPAGGTYNAERPRTAEVWRADETGYKRATSPSPALTERDINRAAYAGSVGFREGGFREGGSESIAKSAESPRLTAPALVGGAAVGGEAIKESAPSETTSFAYSGNTPVETGDDCVTAQAEADKAKYAGEVADKLFHLRRALRLCPEQAAFHNSLGEVYQSLNRTEDAAFEFQEALRVDPNMQVAQDNLNALSSR